MYENMLELLVNNGADVCVCNYEYVDEYNNLLPVHFTSPI